MISAFRGVCLVRTNLEITLLIVETRRREGSLESTVSVEDEHDRSEQHHNYSCQNADHQADELPRFRFLALIWN